MRMLWPNLDREDGLETVLEVPIPEEVLPPNPNKSRSSWQNMISWVRPYHNDHDKSSPPPPTSIFGASRNNAEIQLLLGVVGAPLIPLPISSGHPLNRNIREHAAIEASMAKYIVKQYIAAAGGEKALNSIDSMYAMGKVKMVASEFVNAAAGEGLGSSNTKATRMIKSSSRVVRNGGGAAGGGGGEVVGGFVLWQKRPELWCLELVVSGCKISAGSDGKVAWRQTPWHHSHASRGPPRPLRRALQGLDPRSTANLFSNSICIGEKNINNEDCFVLKLEAGSSTLRARSSSNVEIIQHTVWGYFSQRTGLLVQLEDSHLLRIKSPGNSDYVFWETTMVSNIRDYKAVDGINIAHAGRTAVSLVRYGDHHHHHQTSGNHSSCTRMEEIWAIEEVDFNIKGLSTDCFLPPGDLIITKKEAEGCGVAASNVVGSNVRLPFKIRAAGPSRVGVSKIVAIDVLGPENV